MTDYAVMNQAVYEGKADEVKGMTEQAIAEGIEPTVVLAEGLTAGMSVVGEDFKQNRIFVPQVLVAARAMKAGTAVLQPLLSEHAESASSGTVVIGTVKGDLHDIGKNIVCMMSEGAAFTMIDLGVDCPVEKYVEAAREHKPHILGMSALLTTTMRYMKTVIDAFRAEDDLKHIQLCVGGAPVTQMFADEIGADGYANDAGSAVALFKELVPKKS
jgi:5-methyltetrahydrofolate--homocysteine methyltransferase